MVVSSVDELSTRQLLSEGLYQWILDHEEILIKYADDNFSEESDYKLLGKYLDDEKMRYVIYLYMKHFDRNWCRPDIAAEDIVLKKLEQNGLLLLCGSMGSGKTCLAHHLAEEMYKRGTPVWWYGAPVALPKFYTGSSLDINSIPENTLTVMDESAIQFSARDSQNTEQKQELKLLPITRHGNKSYIFIVQNASMMDITLIRLASAIIFTNYVMFSIKLKDRIKIHDQLKFFMPKKQGRALYFDDDNLFILNFQLPDWWSDKYSRPYAKFKNKAEEYRFFINLHSQIAEQPERIQEYMRLKGSNINDTKTKLYSIVCQKYYSDKLLEMKDTELIETFQKLFSEKPIGETGRICNYNFTQTPIQAEEWKQKLLKKPELIIQSGICINPILEKEIQDALKHRNIIISVKGATGSGKSYASISIAEYITKLLPDSKLHISFDPEEIMTIIQTANEHDIIVCEEAGIKRLGVGSGRQKIELRNAEETLRKKQINFIFNSPTLHEHLHHFILETHSLDRKENISKLMVYTPTELLIGYITLRKPSEKILKDYEKKKDLFLNKVIERKTSERSTDKMVLQIINHPDWKLCSTKVEKARFVSRIFPHLSSGESTNLYYDVIFCEKKQEHGENSPEAEEIKEKKKHFMTFKCK